MKNLRRYVRHLFPTAVCICVFRVRRSLECAAARRRFPLVPTTSALTETRPKRRRAAALQRGYQPELLLYPIEKRYKIICLMLLIGAALLISARASKPAAGAFSLAEDCP